jgi:hypothetical protein
MQQLRTSKKESSMEYKDFPSILKTSRQLRQEAAEIYYVKNTLAMDERTFTAWKTFMPAAHKLLLNTVELRETTYGSYKEKARETKAREMEAISGKISSSRFDIDKLDAIVLPPLGFEPLSSIFLPSTKDIAAFEKAIGIRQS